MSPNDITGGSTCASSSPAHPAGSARPPSPSCSRPATRSSVWPARTRPPPRVAALGAEVRRGDLDDLDGLRAAAADSDGVIHLGYSHADFSPNGMAAAA